MRDFLVKKPSWSDLGETSKNDWIGFSTNENAYALNPRIPEEDQKLLVHGLQSVAHKFDAHLFLLSSGTSTRWKWVALRKSAILAAAQGSNQFLSPNRFKGNNSVEQRWLLCLPSFHIAGVSTWARAFLSQSHVWELSVWSADRFLELVNRFQITQTSLVPSQLKDLLQREIVCPPSLRFILIGGGALFEQDYWSARKLGWPVLPTYGMTETSAQLATASPESLYNTDSIPSLEVLPHVQVRKHCSEEDAFEVFTDSLLTAWIYVEASGEVTVVDPKKDGWFQPEDCGRLSVFSDRTELLVLGRKYEFVKIAGESVSLAPLREVLSTCKSQGDIDVELIAIPHERYQNVLVLVSDQSLQFGQAKDLAQEFAKKVLPIEKLHGWYRFSKIPRTTLGKFKASECLSQIQNQGVPYAAF